MFLENYNLLNSLFIVVLWILGGLMYPYFYMENDNNASIQFFQEISTLIICGFMPLIIFIILLYQLLKIKKEPEIKKRRKMVIEMMVFKEPGNNVNISKDEKLRINIHRKILHLIPVAIILFCWIFSINIWQDLLNQNEIWGISGKMFGQFLILTIGYSAILLFAILDYIRLSFIFENHEITWLIPDNVLNFLNKSIKSNEKIEFLSPTSLILSFVPIFFLPFEIFASAVLVSTISDGLASIMGIKFEKNLLPQYKSKIGYGAGFFSAFIIMFLTIKLFNPLVEFILLFIVSLVGALTFLIIDLIDIKIDDNILNPLFCGFFTWISYISLPLFL
ncbi:MAG: hypothetical protein ACTSUN_10195 [Promethearchaeota archaeon]